MVEALKDYTAIWQKGCTPPGSTEWSNIDNNKAFLAQTVVMTANTTLSIPAALRTARPDDYYKNAVTIEWPSGADGRPLVIDGFISRAVVFKAGRNSALVGDFVRFLAEEGWLAHWLTFAGDRYLPPMRKLVEQPFWLDPKDPHRMRAAIQILTQLHQLERGVRDKEWQSGRIWDENVWGKAVHRVAVEGITPEQAIDEAIARIKQILSE
jgi:multiple sugar transport system substrate-binding protein